jgi:hypothetical protein
MDGSEVLEELIIREIEQTEKEKNTDQRVPKIDMLNWILDEIREED